MSGEIDFDEAGVRAGKARDAAVVLVRHDAETRDIAALELADGLLTCRGARTSHAAVVGRQLGKVCLVGCEAMTLDAAGGWLELNGMRLALGDYLTLDGDTGLIHAGQARVVTTMPEALVERLRQLHGRA